MEAGDVLRLLNHMALGSLATLTRPDKWYEQYDYKNTINIININININIFIKNSYNYNYNNNNNNNNKTY